MNCRRQSVPPQIRSSQRWGERRKAVPTLNGGSATTARETVNTLNALSAGMPLMPEPQLRRTITYRSSLSECGALSQYGQRPEKSREYRKEPPPLHPNQARVKWVTRPAMRPAVFSSRMQQAEQRAPITRQPFALNSTAG